VAAPDSLALRSLPPWIPLGVTANTVKTYVFRKNLRNRISKIFLQEAAFPNVTMGRWNKETE